MERPVEKPDLPCVCLDSLPLAMAYVPMQRWGELYTCLLYTSISPVTFESLTGNKCVVDTFDRNFQFNIQHISLAKRADVVPVSYTHLDVYKRQGYSRHRGRHLFRGELSLR